MTPIMKLRLWCINYLLITGMFHIGPSSLCTLANAYPHARLNSVPAFYVLGPTSEEDKLTTRSCIVHLPIAHRWLIIQKEALGVCSLLFGFSSS